MKRIGFAIIIAVVVLLVGTFAATKIIYDATFVRYECEQGAYPPALENRVAARETFHYPSGENDLCGYLYRCDLPADKNAVIVFAPGHNACADTYLWQIHELLERGWSVFAFDATGCCDSEGDSAKGFPQEILDLEATLNYIEKQNRFGYNDIILLGHSRGGYAACCALRYDYDITAVVSVSGVNSAMESVIGSAERYVGPLAYGNYGMLWLYQTMLFGSDLVDVRADRVISETDTPVLLIHGQADTVVPWDKYSIVSYRQEITNENVEYILCAEPQNAEHVNILFDNDGTANDELLDRINNFLERNLER